MRVKGVSLLGEAELAAGDAEWKTWSSITEDAAKVSRWQRFFVFVVCVLSVRVPAGGLR